VRDRKGLTGIEMTEVSRHVVDIIWWDDGLSRRRSRVGVSSLPPLNRLKCRGSWNPPAPPFLLAPSSRDFEGDHGEVDRIAGY
jgi:hypothetical protein